MPQPLKIMIIAGEASGDMYGGLLAREILGLNSKAVLFGFGGDKMAQAGVKVVYPLVDLAVMGFVKVLTHLRKFRYVLSLSRQLLKSEVPDVLVLIDFPGFNLRVAKQAKALGIPVVYYISPQVWAWRPGRTRVIAQLVNKMLVVFPFEVPIYKQANCPVEFVGHPLLDALKGVRKLSRSSNKSLVALMPGSRYEEVTRLLAPMLRVAERLAVYEPIDFILPLAPTITRGMLEPHLGNAKVFVKVVTRKSLSYRKACDFALVASGTATLETALMEVPMIILYRVSQINYWIAKRVVRIPYIGLANIVAGKRIVPEFLQDELDPNLIVPTALSLLQDTEQREQMKKDLASVVRSLGGGGASKRAAKAVLEAVRGQGRNK